MPFINLIEEQRRQSRRNDGRVRIAFFAAVTSATLVVLGWGAFAFRIDRVRSEQAHLRTKIQKQAPILSEITLNVKEAGILEPKVKTLEDGQKLTDKWSRILAHLTTQTPRDTWFTAIRSTDADEEAPTAVTFIGMSSGQEPISELILRLQNSKDLDAVNLKASRPKDFNGKPYAEFEIVAQVHGTAKPPAPKVENKDGGKA